MTKYISTDEAAGDLGVSRSRLLHLLKDGRIEGAVKEGSKYRGEWKIPFPVVELPPERPRGRPKQAVEAS